MNISENIKTFKQQLPDDVTLIAVSKTKPVSEIMEAYNAGHRIFGENKVQEMERKWQEMPKDVEWHMIGHVQRNKVKYIAPFVSLIHSVDSKRLLKEINKRAKNENRVIDCLLQVKIAEEESKFGLDKNEVLDLLASEAFANYKNVKVIGLMGMATFTDNEMQIAKEFQKLKDLYDNLKEDHEFTTLSMGMSGDYEIALKKGSNMVRVGSAIFGERNY
ncbi:YggS family pyridoxal phosphate-dependent enzyme [Marixanthomonas spongiae]|uniref:Pyridoxal phosphate homeostasis protein n=1 Tax=Marixanthomonas spongiae TaxID=2174845 RepID=A0A2U0I608_9FLAO|nr:YggS family pyridoxal phosphate-dependent enzyme [Marixanthomonas spongiae]PVW16543.1 YggS family pyridoxal phosphate-dependent enzyme [Marixanthomonas spongiae]